MLCKGSYFFRLKHIENNRYNMDKITFLCIWAGGKKVPETW